MWNSLGLPLIDRKGKERKKIRKRFYYKIRYSRKIENMPEEKYQKRKAQVKKNHGKSSLNLENLPDKLSTETE